MTTRQENDDFNIPAPLVFTEAAARKVWSLIQEEDNPALKLRVFITGGGCSGFQYGFTFDEDVKTDDTCIEKCLSLAAMVNADTENSESITVTSNDSENVEEDEGSDNGDGEQTRVTLLVDPMSLQYLTGAEIDYKEDIEGAQFIIRNPNAQTTCGCGSSFSV